MNLEQLDKIPGRVIRSPHLRVSSAKKISNGTPQLISKLNDVIQRKTRVNLPEFRDNFIWWIDSGSDRILLDMTDSGAIRQFVEEVRLTVGGICYIERVGVNWLKVLFKEAYHLKNDALAAHLEVEADSVVCGSKSLDSLEKEYIADRAGCYVIPNAGGFENGFLILPLAGSNSALKVAKTNRYAVDSLENIGGLGAQPAYYSQIAPAFVDYASPLSSEGGGSIGQYLRVWKQYTESVEAVEKERARKLGAIKYSKVQIDTLEQEAGEEEETRLVFSGLDWSGFSGSYKNLSDRHFQIPISEEEFRSITLVEAGENYLEAVAGKISGIPPAGEIVLSTAGAGKIAERRKEAINLLVSGQACLKDLPEILERGPNKRRKPTPNKEIDFGQRAQKDLCAHFGIEFSQKQLAIIKNAVHTPDIFLLQGPPGTGKTTVIRAICHILNENNKTVGLSSQQNDAITNLLSKFPVSDVPPIRRLPYSARRDGDSKMARDLGHDFLNWLKAKREATERKYHRLPGMPLAELATEASKRIQAARTSTAPIEEFDKLAAFLETKGIPIDGLTAAKTALQDWKRTISERKLIANRASKRAELKRLSDSELNDLCARLFPKSGGGHEFEGQDRKYLENYIEQKVQILNNATHPCSYMGRFQQSLDAYSRSVLVTQEGTLLIKSILYDFSNRLGILIDKLENAITNNGNVLEIVQANFGDYSEVFAATCQMMGAKDESLQTGQKFDFVIIDEAARATPADLIIPMSRAEKVILVGDHIQLPHFIEDEAIEDVAFDEEELLRNSLFKRLFEQCASLGEELQAIRTGTLTEERRMHPDLGAFVSRAFYPNILESAANAADRTLPADIGVFNDRSCPCAVFVHVPKSLGSERRSDRTKSLFRPPEAAAVVSILERLSSKLSFEQTEGIPVVAAASFYREQRDVIKNNILRSERLKNSPNIADIATTVDAFQGKEADIFILSATRCGKDLGFLNSKARLCVAFSRARKLFVIVGDKDTLENSEPMFDYYYDLCKGQHYVFTDSGDFVKER